MVCLFGKLLFQYGIIVLEHLAEDDSVMVRVKFRFRGYVRS